MKTVKESTRQPKQNKTVTMSFSLDQDTKRMIETMAKTTGKSKSDVVRDNVRYYQWKSDWEKLQAELAPVAKKHHLHSDDDIYKFLDS